MSKFPTADLAQLKRYSIKSRASKVQSRDFAKAGAVNTKSFLECLPQILKAADLQELIASCKHAKQEGKAIIVGLGGHVIKCGLAPLLIEMLKAGYINCIICNGSVAIHDFEIAMYGNTSEDVAKALQDGSFGMAIETADGINNIISDAYNSDMGYGEALGAYLHQHAANRDISLLASASESGIPMCVHVALGTDIIHQHDSANPEAIGAASMKDFRILCHQMQYLNGGGVYLNFGSAVILPEVFLKALTVARNLYGEVDGFSTAVFDMNVHYRPGENIVKRPTQCGGKGYYFVGHHEIMIPLFIKSLLYN